MSKRDGLMHGEIVGVTGDTTRARAMMKQIDNGWTVVKPQYPSGPLRIVETFEIIEDTGGLFSSKVKRATIELWSDGSVKWGPQSIRHY